MENLRLYCRQCGTTYDLSPLLAGCPASPDGQHPHTLEVIYDYERILAQTEINPETLVAAARQFVDYADLLPGAVAIRQLSLKEGRTPLVPLAEAADRLGLAQIYVKDESRNPTGSFKDRLNLVAVAMAKQFGITKLVSSTTGNHGVSLAAYGARARMKTLVLCPPQSSDLTLQQARHYGAYAFKTTWEGRGYLLRELVREHGWYLSNRNDPQPFGNPFGVEGYKTIAYEIVQSLDGRAPDFVFVPTGGGDSLAGIWKGFRELQELSVITDTPRMIACQPAQSPSLVKAIEHNLNRVAPVSMHDSVAVSISDPMSGCHALRAIRESDGAAVALTEDEITEAEQYLGRQGLCLEPSSAASYAGLLRYHADMTLSANTTAVCIGTGSGLRWPWTFIDQPATANVIEPTLDALQGAIGAL